MLTIDELISDQDIPVLMADDTGVITYVNPAFEKVFHWKCENLTGQPLTVLIPEKLHDAHNLAFSRHIVTGTDRILGKPLELAILNGRGEKVMAEHFILSEEREGKRRLAARILPRD